VTHRRRAWFAASLGAFVWRCAKKAPLALPACVAALLTLAASAHAAPPPPIGIEVQGGEDAWHPTPRFRLDWDNPPGVAAVHYRVRDPQGAIVVAERRIGWAASLAEMQVPDVPAAYRAEIWLEDAGGGQGPPAVAALRFDNTRPGAVTPHVLGTWIGRNAFPLALRLEHPGAEPPSGIRGYAVAIDPVPGREPCAAADRCTAAETDLAGGADDDALEVAGLPEGTSYVSAVAVSGSGMRSSSTGRATLHVDMTPPVVQLSGTPAGWTNKPVTLTARATDDASGMLPDGNAPAPFTAIRVDGGRPVVEPGAEVSAPAIGEGVHSVAYYARDLAGNVADGGTGNGVPNPAPQTTEVRIDRTAPGVAFLNAQDPLDPELIRVKVADPLSGPDPSRGWIGVRRAGSGDPFLPLAPAAVPPGELGAHWDSDAFPPGEYEFEATGYDRAGNAATSTRRADGEEMTLTNPLKAAASLRAGFGGVGRLGQGPRLRSTRYGRGAVLSGRLTEGQGTPLPHRPVRIVERFAAGAPAERVSLAWTAADGSFSAPLLPGPSREAIAVFDGSANLTHAVSQPLQLGVRSGVRLRASSSEARVGGAPLVLSGRVAASPGTIPAEGKSVELQFRVAGLPWSEFRTLKTDRHGRFRFAYRFTDDDSRGVRFQFRAYAPAQDGWPYEPGGSLPVIVRGR
jgi:hypothetical protein